MAKVKRFGLGREIYKGMLGDGPPSVREGDKGAKGMMGRGWVK